MNDPAFVIWFTGLSGAGKSTISDELVRRLKEREENFELLDGDVVRTNHNRPISAMQRSTINTAVPSWNSPQIVPVFPQVTRSRLTAPENTS